MSGARSGKTGFTHPRRHLKSDRDLLVSDIDGSFKSARKGPAMNPKVDRAPCVVAAVESRPAGRWVTVWLLVALTACTSTGEDQTSNAVAEPSTAGAASAAVLTDNSCTSEPVDSMSPGPFTLAVRNDSSSTGSFELFRIGVPYDEFAAYYAEEHQILQAGQPPRASEGGVLPAATDVHQVLDLAPGGSGELVGDLTEGTYAVLCEQLDESGDYAGVFSVGPFDVTA
jgi:hypothetical protein